MNVGNGVSVGVSVGGTDVAVGVIVGGNAVAVGGTGDAVAVAGGGVAVRLSEDTGLGGGTGGGGAAVQAINSMENNATRVTQNDRWLLFITVSSCSVKTEFVGE